MAENYLELSFYYKNTNSFKIDTDNFKSNYSYVLLLTAKFNYSQVF